MSQLPYTTQLNQGRLSRMIQMMEKMGFSQMIVSSPYTIYYLTGCYIPWPGERCFALYLNNNGEVTMAYNKVQGNDNIQGVKMGYYDDTEDGVALLAEQMVPGKLAVEKTWTVNFLLHLCEIRPDIQPYNGSEIIDRTRMVKDAEEREKMRQSSAMLDIVYEKLFQRFQPSYSEIDFADVYMDVIKEVAGRSIGGFTLVAYGPGASEPHHNNAAVYAKEGDCVLVDGGRPFTMYGSDVTRTGFYKKVSAEHRRIYETVLAANLAGIAAVKPGVRCCDVDRAARKVIEDAGYGPYFTHRLGHNIGLEGHEWPDIGPNCQLELQPGMCFSIEPGIYLPGDVGVRIEDVVMCTEEGAEVLNHYTKELQILG